MSSYKNTSGDYTITVDDGLGNLFVNGDFYVSGDTDITGNFAVAGSNITLDASSNVQITAPLTTILGNLTVEGNLTYINVNELTVDDPFIVVAGNNQGNIANALFPNQGLVTQTSSNTYAGLRFNNGNMKWEVSNSVASTGAPINSYQALALEKDFKPGGPNNAIQTNVGNLFYGDMDFQYDPANAQVLLDGYIVMYGIGNIPPATPNGVSMFHQAEGAGDSGLYIKTDTSEGELVTKNRAVVFGLIL